MPVELWSESRSTPIPNLRFSVVTPGVDKIKQVAIRNSSNKVAKSVMFGATITSPYRGGGTMILENNWLFGRLVGTNEWQVIKDDILNYSVLIGDMNPYEIKYVEIKISLPPPKVIKTDLKCKGGPTTIYDLNLPPEFILKLLVMQL